jgi:hypothetical protein
MRMILAALSERAAAESRKCCAMITTGGRTDQHLSARVSQKVQPRIHRWRQLHKAVNTRFWLRQNSRLFESLGHRGPSSEVGLKQPRLDRSHLSWFGAIADFGRPAQ